AEYLGKQERMAALKQLLETSRVNGLPEQVAEKVGNVNGQTFAQILKRPEVDILELAPALRELTPGFFDISQERPTAWMRAELKSVETEIKYSGYLEQQQRAIEHLKKAEQRNIPEWFDYGDVSGLSREMKE